MENQFQLPRTLLAYAIVIPLALVLGFFLIVPESSLTVMLVGLVLLIVTLPLLLKYHHALLVVGWGAYINAFFLPGQPPLWMLLAFMSFSIAVLQRIVTGKTVFMSPRSLTLPMIFLAGIAVMTAALRGGVGFRALGGGAYGAKSYMLIVGAVVGFFAIASNPIPKKKAMAMTGLFFLSSISALFSNIAYALGPKFFFLFTLFPVELVMNQALQDYGGVMTDVNRIVGISFASTGLYFFLMLRYGPRGVFDIRRPWRMLLFLLAVGAALFGGFRGIIILFALIFLKMMFWEKLFKTRFFLAVLTVTLLGGITTIAFIEKMPLTIQRALSFLPINVDAAAAQDAFASTEWRLEMWQILWPQIPDYLWLGKGYSIDPTDLYLADEAVRRGWAKTYEPSLIAGNYHSGPLSTIIPMGIWGVIGLLWMFIAGALALYRNYKYGDPELRRINTFLLAYFLVRASYFLAIFGAFNTELYIFTGVLGLSMAINGGVRTAQTKRVAAVTATPHPTLLPQPA